MRISKFWKMALRPALSAFGLTVLLAGGASSAHADYAQRLSLGVGLAELQNSSNVEFEVGIEYEYRLSAMWGVGAFAEHIFTDPGITLIGVPQVSFHPLAGEWLVSASPLARLISGFDTDFGARFGTRLPIPLGVITLIPTFAVDVISGGPDYIFGIGLQF